MSVELPTPREWLEAELRKRGWTGRELARQVGIPSSSVANFASGDAGPQTCLDVARALSVSPMLTLAVMGLVPPLPRADDVRWGSIVATYGSLNEDGRNQLLDYAQFLLFQQRQL